jgi:hypothetical protein
MYWQNDNICSRKNIYLPMYNQAPQIYFMKNNAKSFFLILTISEFLIASHRMDLHKCVEIKP